MACWASRELQEARKYLFRQASEEQEFRGVERSFLMQRCGKLRCGVRVREEIAQTLNDPCEIDAEIQTVPTNSGQGVGRHCL